MTLPVTADPTAPAEAAHPITQRWAQRQAQLRLRQECAPRYRRLLRDFRAARHPMAAAKSMAMAQLVREYRGVYRAFYAEELAVLYRGRQRVVDRTDERDAAARAWLGELEEFVAASGRLPEAGSPLRSWMARVKAGRQWVPEELRARLDELVAGVQAVSLAERAAVARQRLALVERFVGEHGRMPQQQVAEEHALYWWYSRYRRAAWLPDDLRARVAALAGAVAGAAAARALAAQQRWVGFFEQFVDEHGRMPRYHHRALGRDLREVALYRWVSEGRPDRLPAELRDRYERLAARARAGDQAAREARDRDRNAARHEWWIGEFEAFVAEHGRLPGTQGRAEETALFQWAARWRLRPDWPVAVRDRYERLTATVGRAGDAAARAARHRQWLGEVEAFVAEHGRLPRLKTAGGEGRLADWMRRALRGEKKLAVPERAWLDRLAGSVEVRDKTVEARERALARRLPVFEEFVRTHGRLPQAGVPGESGLYQWWRLNAVRQDWPAPLRARFDAAWAAAEAGRSS